RSSDFGAACTGPLLRLSSSAAEVGAAPAGNCADVASRAAVATPPRTLVWRRLTRDLLLQGNARPTVLEVRGNLRMPTNVWLTKKVQTAAHLCIAQMCNECPVCVITTGG